MDKYLVEITETTRINLDVEASSKEEAEKIASAKYQNNEYSLSAVNIIGTKFSAQIKQSQEVL